MARPEQIQQLDRQVQAAVERALRGMREQFGGRLRQASEELLRLLQEAPSEAQQSFIHEDDVAPIVAAARTEGRNEALTALRDGMARVDRAATQETALEALLQSATLFSSRSALFLTRESGARGWGGFGFGESANALADLEMPYADAPWAEIAEGRGCVALDEAACARLCVRLEASMPRQGVLVPLVLRDQVAAALYADRLTDGSRFDVEALQVLTLHAALAIETLPFRQRTATPTLRTADPEAPALGLWQPTPVDSVSAEAPIAAEPAIAREPMLQTIEDWSAEAATPAVPEAAEPAPAADLAGASAALESGALSWSAFSPEPEPEPAPFIEEPPVLFEEEPEQLYEPPVEQARAATEFVPVAEPAPEPIAVEPASDEAWVLDDTAVPELGEPALEAPIAEPEPEPAVFAAPEPEIVSEPRPEPFAPASADLWAAPPAVELPATPAFEPLATTAIPVHGLNAPVPETTAPLALGGGDDETMLLERPTRFPQAPPVERPPLTPSTQEMQIPDANDETHPGLRRGAATEAAPRAAWQPGGGSSEVRPPADLAGPGWAFATSRVASPAAPPGEESLHDEARRLARLLVSEIKLYNEEQVEEGRRGRDIYERLKEDIDRSRQMYEERVDERVRNKTDYFYQELVRILAAGDAKALGI